MQRNPQDWDGRWSLFYKVATALNRLFFDGLVNLIFMRDQGDKPRQLFDISH